MNKECQRYEKGHLEIRKMKIKDAKYLIVLNMNWDYVCGKKKKKKKKENKNKQTKRKKINKKINK